ncbi:EVE domain-containing protein [Arenicella chitinivorans]|uniref:EVE domain-containing protein n=1 Tax=Arenicella chitinivorans TaxID=1329800 RepID=A0A918VJ17_9GAMM|nr:EVE domain-containing protein [Arenicella chitinivorans]GHA00280.1 EVE domain-containing protein [Arenicella chitinivorans]
MTQYWLFKSEPDEYSIDDLAAEPSGVGVWDGIRNYQARNLLRDKVKQGDKAFFYHSSCKQVGIAGRMTVVRAGYPDPAQFDQGSGYYDAKASMNTPRWYCVDVSFEQKFARTVLLSELKELAAEIESPPAEMVLLNQSRLSIQPVTGPQWAYIVALAQNS